MLVYSNVQKILKQLLALFLAQQFNTAGNTAEKNAYLPLYLNRNGMPFGHVATTSAVKTQKFKKSYKIGSQNR
jgi:acid phosphatase family membrane protein YuiD